MAYKVIFQDSAIRSLDQIYAYIAKDNPTNALRYIRKLRKSCATLTQHPKRCPYALENGLQGLEIRHLIHDPYRIIFTVSDTCVHVLEIRHAARRPWGV